MNQGQAMWALEQLLAKAIAGLAGLPQPVVVAACPQKFDDTFRYPNWLGVQVGTAWWELAEYDAHPVVEETGDPTAVEPARLVLADLQRATWRWLTERALDSYLNDEVLALVIQHDVPWIVISASNAGLDLAFLIQAEGDLLPVGQPDRLDTRLGHWRPLRLTRIDPAAWPAIRAAAPGFPICPSPPPSDTRRARRQHDTLTASLNDAFAAMAALPGWLRYVASSGVWTIHAPASAEGDLAIALDDVRSSARQRNGRRMYSAGRGWAPSAGAAQDNMDRLDKVLDALEAARWRDLFSAAVTPLRRDESLALLLLGDQRWLIMDGTIVFTPTPDGGLVLAGACDLIDDIRGIGTSHALHLLDGRSVSIAAPAKDD